jgi:nitroimidazol reductase NimA-like FMN-containing flavoprotein (pyridoxamine 5'-phosphate oxidase superfamily)
MLIQDLSKEECFSLLSRIGFGKLACAQSAQPYIVPIYFSVEGHNIYAFSTIGQKITWMRTNPLVCLEADEIITAQKWQSVIVLGRYHTVADESEQEMIHRLLARKANWWEPGYARTVHGGHDRPIGAAGSLEAVYFRISVESITGRIATPLT